MILSTYISDDGRAKAEVQLAGIYLRVVCSLKSEVVAVINTFIDVASAEDFAEDFVLNKNNKKEEHEYDREYSVLYRIAEPNERDSKSCLG